MVHNHRLILLWICEAVEWNTTEFNVFVIPKITKQNHNQKLIHSRNCNLKEWKFYAIIALEFLLFHIYFDRLKKMIMIWFDAISAMVRFSLQHMSVWIWNCCWRLEALENMKKTQIWFWIKNINDHIKITLLKFCMLSKTQMPKTKMNISFLLKYSKKKNPNTKYTKIQTQNIPAKQWCYERKYFYRINTLISFHLIDLICLLFNNSYLFFLIIFSFFSYLGFHQQIKNRKNFSMKMKIKWNVVKRS